ncbi:hypothetical protein [Tunicatimonas pelagia]|uniref:hypothetical protein n=1 Tax=Tunicatimonas pelagia TaxID=931531 RepID=UPI0026655C66|nr:hypothetical protein [Tunicatimonas pelagia]WKN44737.1 hypothetical protein P0M28_07140 [Tunicatimonas pelagia]
MENITVDKLMRLIVSLDTAKKLEIMAQLSENLKASFRMKDKDTEKQTLLNKLAGAWNDTDEQLADSIVNSRTVSDKNLKFN